MMLHSKGFRLKNNIIERVVAIFCVLRTEKTARPCDSDADQTDDEIVEGLMEITALSLSDTLDDEPAYE
jgi:hypothetical protein